MKDSNYFVYIITLASCYDRKFSFIFVACFSFFLCNYVLKNDTFSFMIYALLYHNSITGKLFCFIFVSMNMKKTCHWTFLNKTCYKNDILTKKKFVLTE